MQQERDVIAPASKPQELFINSEADITIASGSSNICLRVNEQLLWFTSRSNYVSF